MSKAQLHIVNDSSNDSPIYHDQIYGYNDLQRRKEDLCNLAGSPCNTKGIVKIIDQLLHAPLHD